MSSRHRIEVFKTEMEMRGLFAALKITLLSVLGRLLAPKVMDFDKKYGTLTNDRVEVSQGDIPLVAIDTAVYLPKP